MFEINSKYEYSEQLKTTYKLKYDTDNSNLTALHQFILAFLKSSQFVDEENNTNYEVINEFVEYLSIIVNTNDAEPYEALFYYEINRALGNDSIIEEWFEKYPEYVEHCKICVMSYDILMHIGLYDAALKCCQDIYNVSLIVNVDYMNRYSNTLIKSGRANDAFEFMKSDLESSSYYAAPHLYSRITKLAIGLDKKEEMLNIFRAAIDKHPYVKWVSREYISLCMDFGLDDEGQKEYERLLAITKHYYDESPITTQTMGLFKYYCSVRKLLGMTFDKVEVAQELGFEFAPETKQQDKSYEVKNNSPWENDFNKFGNKALLKRVNKMNKPLRTYFKVFAGGEKELIYAKSILGNYISIIHSRFYSLFGEGAFEVTDYNKFYEAFPFYELNGFTEEEIDDISTLLNRIRQVSVQLNPFVTSRSFPANQMLVDLLSINTEILYGNKTYNYAVVDRDGTQLTVFGVILFMITFLNGAEKEAFAFELAGADLKLMYAFLNQIVKTIPASTLNAGGHEGFKDAGREKGIFSIYVRKELLRILLEIECQIIKEFNQLDPDRPNINSKHFNQMLSLKYEPDSPIYNNLNELHMIVVNGKSLGEESGNFKFSIENIVNLLEVCADNDPDNDLFQAGIESLFMICTNRKYYNQLKKTYSPPDESFLKNRDNYCRKMLYRNRYLMTEDDEYALYDCSREHIFTFIDDSQRDEFSSLFGCKQRDWEKIEITIYKIDPEKATCSINDNEQIGEYFILFGDERLSVNPNPGYSLQGWNEVEKFDTPMATMVIKEAIL